jgi:hypothetical protein
MLTTTLKAGETVEFPVNVQKGSGGEYVVLCPGCKALQTLTVVGNNILPTRKFSQAGDNVYHDCGYPKACRLYKIT